MRFEAAHKLHAHIPIAEKIHFKDPAQIIILGFITGLETGPDAGIIEQNIDMAEMGPCFISQSGDLRHIGDIAGHADHIDAMVQCANLIGRFVASGLLNIGNHHMAFFSRQTFADIKPDTIGTAADHRDFICKIFHSGLPINYRMLASRSFTCNAPPAIYKG